ncbi:hypothetical protein LX32DRAFT_149354 [Colletotrichum zoysiae]|uniref:Uncharacterized protein n=1 Tax=Colletotrichum zoysiae TaxID=1216348 RepID=A0AAD9LYU7_9PEZI|nr:hypothetical protein LX32DRAFT_149354 [Colletotrichum zoysiae]
MRLSRSLPHTWLPARHHHHHISVHPSNNPNVSFVTHTIGTVLRAMYSYLHLPCTTTGVASDSKPALSNPGPSRLNRSVGPWRRLAPLPLRCSALLCAALRCPANSSFSSLYERTRSIQSRPISLSVCLKAHTYVRLLAAHPIFHLPYTNYSHLSLSLYLFSPIIPPSSPSPPIYLPVGDPYPTPPPRHFFPHATPRYATLPALHPRSSPGATATCSPINPFPSIKKLHACLGPFFVPSRAFVCCLLSSSSYSPPGSQSTSPRVVAT